jgi:beta-barrel assembly-enhancing protease
MKLETFFFATFLLLASCSTTPEVASSQSSEELERLAQEVNDEVVVGRQMAAKLLGHFGTLDTESAATAKAEEYVRLVGQTLARRIGRPELKFHFGILKDADVNAFAAPGGYIFVTSGLVKAVRDESELAGILAHEIAHVNERHMADEILPRRDPTAGSVVVSFLSRGRSTLGVSLSSVVNRGMELLLERGLGEPRETEADAAAVSYTASCGYNPMGLMKFLERASAEKSTGKSRPTASRLAQLKSRLAREGVANKSLGDERVMTARFQAALASP